jgi:hypothetical protein
MAQLASGQRDKAAGNLREALASTERFSGRDEAAAALQRLSGA